MTRCHKCGQDIRPTYNDISVVIGTREACEAGYGLRDHITHAIEVTREVMGINPCHFLPVYNTTGNLLCVGAGDEPHTLEDYTAQLRAAYDVAQQYFK